MVLRCAPGADGASPATWVRVGHYRGCDWCSLRASSPFRCIPERPFQIDFGGCGHSFNFGFFLFLGRGDSTPPRRNTPGTYRSYTNHIYGDLCWCVSFLLINGWCLSSGGGVWPRHTSRHFRNASESGFGGVLEIWRGRRRYHPALGVGLVSATTGAGRSSGVPALCVRTFGYPVSIRNYMFVGCPDRCRQRFEESEYFCRTRCCFLYRSRSWGLHPVTLADGVKSFWILWFDHCRASRNPAGAERNIRRPG